eukprot:c17463_g1_i1.p1 GENE.c17463_g1_i1~~c17463_g1_i1.p1  ORF type:complete len:232 (+),score=37.21 c17463_g1_i1:262-957(+)
MKVYEQTLQQIQPQPEEAKRKNATSLPPRLTRAEAVLRSRLPGITLVIPECVSLFDVCACLRTAEAMGVQHVWFVDESNATPQNRAERMEKIQVLRVMKGAQQWLTVRTFQNAQQCALAVQGKVAPSRVVSACSICSVQNLKCEFASRWVEKRGTFFQILDQFSRMHRPLWWQWRVETLCLIGAPLMLSLGGPLSHFQIPCPFPSPLHLLLRYPKLQLQSLSSNCPFTRND